MQEQMKNAQQNNYQGFNDNSGSHQEASPTKKRENSGTDKEDYLDFEEVKD